MISPLPIGPYDLIYADPPLAFATWSDKGDGRSPQRKYRCMTVTKLCALPVSSIAAPNSMLAIWAYGPRLPDTLVVIGAWGFRYVSSGLVWVKIANSGCIHFGTGYYTRKTAELLLLAKRGAGLERRDRGVSEVLLAPRRQHSRKPDEAAERLERLFGPVRRLELFGRGAPRPGWDIWGDEATPAPPTQVWAPQYKPPL
jgi:N6-adenosine-specific RNA methylase IME4